MNGPTPVLAKLGGALLGVLSACNACGKEEERFFDFGPANVKTDGIRIDAGVVYDPERQYGWLNDQPLGHRNRDYPVPHLKTFVFGNAAATFRVDLAPGRYLFEVAGGDPDFADKSMAVALDEAEPLPRLDRLPMGSFAVLRWTADIRDHSADLHFGSASKGRPWAINTLKVVPTAQAIIPEVRVDRPREAIVRRWEEITAIPDAATPWMDAIVSTSPPPGTDVLLRAKYLDVAATILGTFAEKQGSDGSIVDPVLKREVQYATPAYAFAAATLGRKMGREELLDSAYRALKHAIAQFVERRTPDDHDDFFPWFIARAIAALGDRLSPEESGQWAQALSTIDPDLSYLVAPGRGNWNIVASVGEFELHRAGVRSDLGFAYDSIARQAQWFANPWGQYITEGGHLAYDVFARLWLQLGLQRGFTPPYHEEIQSVLDRGIRSAALLLPPSGELPSAGRSSLHVWNDAALAASFELAAARAVDLGRHIEASLYRACAHRAFDAVSRWVDAGGPIVVRNHADGEHGYDPYSHDAQYAMLVAAFLVVAHEAFDPRVSEAASIPSELGSYVLDMQETIGKVFVAHRGAWMVVHTGGPDGYSARGIEHLELGRQHTPQVAASAVKQPQYQIPLKGRADAALGPAWERTGRGWISLASRGATYQGLVRNASVQDSRTCVEFVFTPRTEDAGPTIHEEACLTPELLELGVRLDRVVPRWRLEVPVSSSDGRTAASTGLSEECVYVTANGQVVEARAADSRGRRVASGVPYRGGWLDVLALEVEATDWMRAEVRYLDSNQRSCADADAAEWGESARAPFP